jgi:hypothetical protein
MIESAGILAVKVWIDFNGRTPTWVRKLIESTWAQKLIDGRTPAWVQKFSFEFGELIGA